MDTEVSVTSFGGSAIRTQQWLALSLTPGIGAGRGRKLVELLKGIDRLFGATLTELEGAGLPAAAAQSLALGKSLELAADELDRVKACGARVVAQDDPGFLKRLYEIYDPPLVLHVRRSSEVINEYGLAVVRTRHPTRYGVGMAERLACDLAACGLIVSGYPRENQKLADQILAAGGAIPVSFLCEYSRPRKIFPFKSGLSAECRLACS